MLPPPPPHPWKQPGSVPLPGKRGVNDPFFSSNKKKNIAQAFFST